MPAEGDEHERLWMAFPHGENAGGDAGEVAAAHEAWAAVANAASEFEPVTMVVDPAERDAARRLLSSAVDVVEAPLDDAWMRDIGPSFVLDEHGRLAPSTGSSTAGAPRTGRAGSTTRRSAPSSPSSPAPS